MDLQIFWFALQFATSVCEQEPSSTAPQKLIAFESLAMSVLVCPAL
jgi:hypothetical protein